MGQKELQLKILRLAFLTIISIKSYGQGYYVRDNVFNSADTISLIGADRLKVQPDGKLLVYNGSRSPYLFRFFPDSQRDTSFHFNSAFNIDLIKPLPSGKIYISSTPGAAVGEIKRLHGNGQEDQSFSFADPNMAGCLAMEEQSNGKLVVLYFDNNQDEKLIRLNNDGSHDSTFPVGIVSGDLYDMILQTDDKIILAGEFATYNGSNSRQDIIRLEPDGLVDLSFNLGSANPNVNKLVLALQDDGKILVTGGIQLNSPSQNYPGVLRLNQDGTRDNTLQNYSLDGTFDWCKIKALPNGKIMLAGDMGNPGTPFANGYYTIFRLDSFGYPDSSYYQGLNDQYQNNDLIGDFAEDGTFYFARNTNSDQILFDSVLINYTLKILPDGHWDTTFFYLPEAINSYVSTCKEFQDGTIWVGGDFNQIGYNQKAHILSLNADGSINNIFDPGLGFNNGAKCDVFDLLEFSGDKLLVAGDLLAYNSSTVNDIVSLYKTGALDTSFHFMNENNYEEVLRLFKQNDSKIISLGNIPNPQNSNDKISFLQRLNMDGSVDSSFSTGSGFEFSCSVGCAKIRKNAIQMDSLERIVAGGNISSFNGELVKRILRLNNDGSRDTTFAYQFGFDNEVQAICIQPDQKIIVAGKFTHFDTIPVPSIVRLLETGFLDTTFHFNVAGVSNPNFIELKVLPDGKILSIQGNSQWTEYQSVIRLNQNGSNDSTAYMQYGFNGSSPMDFELCQDGGLLFGGEIFGWDNEEFNNLIKLKEIGGVVTSIPKVNQTFFASRLFPNPAKDLIHITGDEFNRYQLFDITGKLMQSGSIGNSISVSHLETGYYIIELISATSKIRMKFIKE